MGEIVDFTGQTLTLRHAIGREEKIDSQHVVGIEDAWNESHSAALSAMQEHDYAAALEKLQVALRDEQRPWARREIVASFVRCYQQLGQTERAISSFLAVWQSDPTTHHIAAIPLPWTTTPLAPEVQAAADRLLDDPEPVARLIGAGWLLTTARRADAVRTLQQLLGSDDARIVFLAEAQLWRTRASLDDDELRRWQVRVDAMPDSLRAGPYFVLGTALARAGRHETAALTLMRVPILYPGDRRLVAQALLAAAGELAKINRLGEARGLYREVIVEHADTRAAVEARRRFDELAGNPPTGNPP